MAQRIPGNPAPRTTADPGDDLFANVLVTSSRRPWTRWHKIGIGVALGVHALGLAFAVYVMFFAPELLPERPDVLISLIYNPPPPPPPPASDGVCVPHGGQCDPVGNPCCDASDVCDTSDNGLTYQCVVVVK